jgi:hypothetical protein
MSDFSQKSSQEVPSNLEELAALLATQQQLLAQQAHQR